MSTPSLGVELTMLVSRESSALPPMLVSRKSSALPHWDSQWSWKGKANFIITHKSSKIMLISPLPISLTYFDLIPWSKYVLQPPHLTSLSNQANFLLPQSMVLVPLSLWCSSHGYRITCSFATGSSLSTVFWGSFLTLQSKAHAPCTK